MIYITKLKAFLAQVVRRRKHQNQYKEYTIITRQQPATPKTRTTEKLVYA